MEMDVLGNSQKNSNLFPKKFLERLIKILIHGKKEYGPTLHCYVVVFYKKKKKKEKKERKSKGNPDCIYNSKFIYCSLL